MALVCKECGYKQYDDETIREYRGRFPNEEEHDIPYVCGACQDSNNRIVDILVNKWYMDCLVYNLPVSPSDVRDIVEELVSMKKGETKMKSFVLKDYEQFCKEALVMPPFEDDEQIEQWFDEHKIRIIANDCIMQLDYDADAVNEIEFSLREIHEAILGDGTATTGNTKGSEYPDATWKDILKLAVLMIFERNDYNYKGAIKTIHKYFDEVHLRDALMFAEKEYDTLNDHFKVNFLKIDNHEMHKLFDEQERYEALQNILCSNLCIEELYDQEGRCADKVVLTDYSIRPTGDLVGWHYGVDWDRDSEDNQQYIQEYIEEMLK